MIPLYDSLNTCDISPLYEIVPSYFLDKDAKHFLAYIQGPTLFPCES
jgi:hypothetical protein